MADEAFAALTLGPLANGQREGKAERKEKTNKNIKKSMKNLRKIIKKLKIYPC